MGFKKKILGVLAAAALIFSVVMPAGANTVSAPASATLRGSACSLHVSKTSFNFGVWDYDGYGYEINPNHVANQSHSVTWTFTAGDPAGCDATLQFGGLYNSDPNYSSHHIGLEHFLGTLTVFGVPIAKDAPLNDPFLNLGTGFSNTTNSTVAGALALIHPYGLPKFPSTQIDGQITLATVPDDIMPGVYQGTIVSTLTNGQ